MERNPFLGEKGCWHSIPSPPNDFLPIPVLYNMHSTSENYTNISLIFNRYRYIYKLKIIFIKKKIHIQNLLIHCLLRKQQIYHPGHQVEILIDQQCCYHLNLREDISTGYFRTDTVMYMKCTKSTLEIYLENIASVNAFITSRIHVT